MYSQITPQEFESLNGEDRLQATMSLVAKYAIPWQSHADTALLIKTYTKIDLHPMEVERAVRRAKRLALKGA